MTRFIYKQHGAMVIGMTGEEFDSHSPVVRVWDAAHTEHVFDMERSALVDMPTVKILWFDGDTLVHAS